MQTHIVTDSHAHFAHPHLIAQYPVTVVPNTLHIAGTTYREGIELSHEEALELIAHQVTPPKVVPPSVDEYVAVYTALARDHDAILSIHASRQLSQSWANALAAAEQLRGTLPIAVIDSRTLDAAQGMVVRAAVRIIEQENDLDEIVRRVRGATERVYAVYYVETMNYLMRNKLMSPSHAILGTMHETLPLLTVEGGVLGTMEKVRSRSQAVDRLVDFAVEFVDIEDVLILNHRTYMSEQTRALQDRLMAEFGDKHFPHTVYSASLAALIGADGTGLVVLEAALDDDEAETTS